MNIITIIPARGGSKGVPLKNIKVLNGFPLIAYSIIASKKTASINRTIVSTDSREIADIALSFGAEVPFLRPAEMAADRSPDIEYLRHALQWLKDNENYSTDLIILLRPTTPLRDDAVLEKAIEFFNNSTDADSLRSSHKVSESPFKWFRKSDLNFYKPLTDGQSLQDADRPRQSFESVYVPNGYIDIIKPSTIYEQNTIYGNKILCFETEKSYEVDTADDFRELEIYAGSADIKIINDLKNEYASRAAVLEINNFRHIGIVVNEMTEMLNFYKTLLGFEVIQDWTEESDYVSKLLNIPKQKVRMVKMKKNGVSMELLQFSASRPVADLNKKIYNNGYTHIAVGVKKLDEAYKELRLRGIKFISEPAVSSEGFAKVAFCEDPEGNFIELVELIEGEKKI